MGKMIFPVSVSQNSMNFEYEACYWESFQTEKQRLYKQVSKANPCNLFCVILYLLDVFFVLRCHQGTPIRSGALSTTLLTFGTRSRSLLGSWKLIAHNRESVAMCRAAAWPPLFFIIPFSTGFHGGNQSGAVNQRNPSIVIYHSKCIEFPLEGGDKYSIAIFLQTSDKAASDGKWWKENSFVLDMK